MKVIKDLIVWQKSILLTENIYGLAKKLPFDESKNLTLQIKKCSVSIASNIVEGYSRGSKNYYRQLLKVAFASTAELETQLKLIKNLQLLSNPELLDKTNNLLLEILKMLSTMISNVSKK